MYEVTDSIEFQTSLLLFTALSDFVRLKIHRKILQNLPEFYGGNPDAF